MHHKKRWLAYAAVLSGLLIVALFFLAVNRTPLADGFRPVEGELDVRNFCLWCAEDRPLSAVDIFGLALIILLLIAVPAAHVAVLIALAAQLSRPPRVSDFAVQLRCPACNHPLIRPWRVCPYCGERIEGRHLHTPPPDRPSPDL